jgi:outer membrane protein assembly factor BamB
VISTPAVAGEFLYIGEGFHVDSYCKIYCLRADSGEKVWEFETGSHTESSPAFADGKVYCGAGDDGLYCLDANTGKPVWHFTGFHVDAGPVVADGKLYCGAGVGDVFKETIFFCLDARTGDVKWKIATDHPVWGSPAVEVGGLHEAVSWERGGAPKFVTPAPRHGRVYFGIGNGRLNEPDPNPAGAMLCVDAENGEEIWRMKLPDAVYSRPALFAGHLYFGCRDGTLYCLNAKTSKVRWKANTASPVIASVTVAQEPDGGPSWGVYAACSEGLQTCFSAETGQLRWAVDLAEGQRAALEVFSSPRVQETGGKDSRLRVYLGVTTITTSRAGALLCYEEIHREPAAQSKGEAE